MRVTMRVVTIAFPHTKIMKIARSHRTREAGATGEVWFIRSRK